MAIPNPYKASAIQTIQSLWGNPVIEWSGPKYN